LLTKGALYCKGPKSVSRETNRVKQGQGPRSLRPGPFFGPRGGWVLTYAPGRADRWPRTRQPGTRATDRGPGSAALVFVNLGPGSQTRTDQEHKHKHGSRQQLRDQAATGSSSRHQAAAARPARPVATGTRHADQAAAARITAAAALTWQQITASAAVIDQQITANQAARPTAQAATGSSCAAQTRQQLRTIRAPRFTRPVARATGQAQAASSAVG
jgi:hypothetical protein